jgi:hypothetical protein
MPCSGAIVVFFHAHVFLAMKCVLHLPVITNSLSRLGRGHLPARSIGDGVGYFMVCPTRAMMKAGSFDSEDLAHRRKFGKGRIALINGDRDEFASVFTAMAVIIATVV